MKIMIEYWLANVESLRSPVGRYKTVINVRKRKGRPASFQEKMRIIPDDGFLASVINHMPMMVSNCRRVRKCRKKGQEKRTRYM
ncbi:hypothetical protein TNCV_1434301 [Trichonephila clavipes]|nr:hypothetical protein TNCV_1434301 [Trichonephila clavipes]